METRDRVLITATELAALIDAGGPVTILDVRWRVDEPDGREAYLHGHIPGAVYVSLDDELSDHAITGRGRHPLPASSRLQAAARSWGARHDVPVVVYDDWNRAGSARAWWVLTAAGIEDVRILDGGLAAWRSAGQALETGPSHPQPGNVVVPHDDLYAGSLTTLSAAESGAFALLDARAPERFRGDVEPLDRVAGHIPGARNLPSGAVLAADGTFLAPGDLAELPEGDIGVYCGSGVTATVVIAALAAAGRRAALYPGSWSEWSSDPARPVAQGPD